MTIKFIINPDPGSSNAVTFNILRDNQLIAENFDGTVFVDTGLDNNVEYDYDIVSVSVVNTSSLVEEDALTKPGTPILSLSGGDNQIALTWNDPSVTGSDGSIDYQIGRQWIVGDQTYAESITSLDDDAYDQNYVDTGLLNSTAYSIESVRIMLQDIQAGHLIRKNQQTCLLETLQWLQVLQIQLIKQFIICYQLVLGC